MTAAICLLTGADEKASEQAALTVPGKAAYCLKHGYSFICEGPERFDKSRPAAWSKIKFLREHLANFEWLFWSDADTVLLNSEPKLVEMIDPQFDVILAKESPGVGAGNINSGNFFVRRSEWSELFLKTAWEQTGFVNHRWWEQRAIIWCLRRMRGAAQRVKIVPQEQFNASFQRYTAQSFMVHVTRQAGAGRMQLLRELSRRAGGVA